MSIELRIKSKHLALEPAIIKYEERKLIEQIKWAKRNNETYGSLEHKLNSLMSHRRVDVTNEARATFIARAYIAGKSYFSVERNVKDRYTFKYKIFPRVVAMLKKYHSWQIKEEDINKWISE